MATWPDRPTSAAATGSVQARGERTADGRTERIELSFEGRFEELRPLLAPVWPFASGGRLSVEVTLGLRFEPPVRLDDASLATYRTALINANQGSLTVRVTPARGASFEVG
jgi:hypothetical protein